MNRISKGWGRNFEVYSVMFVSLFGGATIVNRIMAPNMDVPAALNLDVDVAELQRSNKLKN